MGSNTGMERPSAQDKKTCSRCGLEKRIRDFAPHNTSKDGRFHACRECENRRREATIARTANGGVYCARCYGMPWRVEGDRCKCGVTAGEEDLGAAYAEAMVGGRDA